MKTCFIMLALVFFMCSPVSIASAEDDPLKEYAAALQKSADAKANNMYGAWADNMAYQIKRGKKPGIVIEGEGSYANGTVQADGIGNVTVDKDARIQGHIINNTEIKNSTVIIKKDSASRSRQ